MAQLKKHHINGICFLVEDFYPLIHGVSTQTILLAEQFIRRGVPVTVVTRQLEPEHSARENLNGIEIHRVKPTVGVHRLGKYLMIIPAFLKMAMRRKDYDVIIVADIKVLGTLGVVIAKMFKKTCLLNQVSCGEFNGGFATTFGPAPTRIMRYIIRLLISARNHLLMKSDGFVSISSAITDELLQSGVPLEKIYLIYCGIDTRKYAPADGEKKKSLRKKLCLPEKSNFLFTGRLNRGKGLEYFLKVWKRLANGYENIHLTIIGSGQGHVLSCEEELKKFVNKNGLIHSVSFTGNVKNVNEYLQAGDYFVFPSQSEGLGISLIEAMACELGCVATSVGGILDIIQPDANGLLVPYGDEDLLYKAIKSLIEDDGKFHRIRKEGRKTVYEKFDIERKAEQYLKLFSKLMLQHIGTA